MFIWLAVGLYLLFAVAVGVRLEGAGGYCPSLRWLDPLKPQLMLRSGKIVSLEEGRPC